MEEALEIFPIILYSLGAILLVILIIIGIKLIRTIDKTNKLLDDAYKKTKSLDGIFNAIDRITDTLSSVNDTIVGAITSVVGKVFSKGKRGRKKKNMEEDEDE